VTRFSRHLLAAVAAAILACGTMLPALAMVPFGVYPGAEYSPTITVNQISPHEIQLDLLMENLPASSHIGLTQPFEGLWGEMNPTGYLLPRFTIFLALPPNGNPTCTVDLWETETYQVYPRQMPENDPQPPRFKLGDVGILGGVRVFPLTIRPLSYVNMDDTCYVVRHAVLRIETDDTEGQNPVTYPPTAFSPAWREVFRALVTNWENIPDIETSAQSHLLLIVPDQGSENYLDDVHGFRRWKEQRGTRVTIIPKSTIAASPTPLQIRTRIAQALTELQPRVDGVVLVGDEDRLSDNMRFTSDPPTRFSTYSLAGDFADENYYAAVEGDDVFPDLFLGRWVVNTAQKTQQIASRSVLHEANPFVVDSLRFERAMVAADITDDSQIQTKRYVRSMLLGAGFENVDTLWGEDVGPQPMVNAVNQGLAFVNYRGSGWSFGWAGVGFYLPTVSELSNSRRLPICTGIGCGVGIFDGAPGSGFAEVWMLAGTVLQPRGAAAFIGLCWNTHTIFNDCLDSCLYRAWLDYGVRQVGSGLVTGKMMTWAILAQFLDESPVLEVTRTMFRQYMVHGDPTLQVYTDTPVRPQVTAPDRIPSLPSEITVTVTNMSELPADSVNVTLWIEDGDFATHWVSLGAPTAVFTVSGSARDSVMVTITGQNVLAYQKRVMIGPEDVSPLPDAPLPQALELAQNYPNPFNSSTAIAFALPRAGHVQIEIFDILGREIAMLADDDLSAGWHRATWDGRTLSGNDAPSGIYFCRLTTLDGVLARKLALVR